MEYLIPKRSDLAEPSLAWDGPLWAGVLALSIGQFHPRSSIHRPTARAKLQLAGLGLHVIFDVRSEYVRSIATQYQDQVSRDSCVELFVQPMQHGGYFNFEFNCGGVMLLYYIIGSADGGGLGEHVPVPEARAAAIRVMTTLPRTIPTESADPVDWRLTAMIPLQLMEHYVGPIPTEAGQGWRGNVFKCASRVARPHWASWSDIGDVLNFHQPDRFGTFRLLESCGMTR
ncbi:MAG: carbohydrate-binding family 9-like protein [Tepidisphaeraceae bacterium]